MNVTITYDTPPEKIARAVEILHEILAVPEVPEDEGGTPHPNEAVNQPGFPPRVFFNDLNADSLNLLVVYCFTRVTNGRAWRLPIGSKCRSWSASTPRALTSPSRHKPCTWPATAEGHSTSATSRHPRDSQRGCCRSRCVISHWKHANGTDAGGNVGSCHHRTGAAAG